MINPTLIWSKSSLNVGGSWRTQDLSFKLLISFTIQSRLKKKTREYIGILPKKFRLFDPMIGADWWPQSHNHREPSICSNRGSNYATNGPRSRDNWATIAWRSGHDRTSIGVPNLVVWSSSCVEVSSRVAHRSLDLILCLPLDSHVRWRSDAPDASTCRQVSHPSRSLKCVIHSRAWLMIVWT